MTPRQSAIVLCAAVLLLVLLPGCAYLPADPSKMTSDQLKAAARDKNSSAACTNAKTAAGNVTMIYVNVDQAVPLGSQVTVEADCKVTINATTMPRTEIRTDAPTGFRLIP